MPGAVVSEIAPMALRPSDCSGGAVKPTEGDRGAFSAGDCREPRQPHNIELDVDGTGAWISRGADPAMGTSIIGALKVRR